MLKLSIGALGLSSAFALLPNGDQLIGANEAMVAFQKFRDFKADFQRVYANDDEEARRFKIFEENLKEIELRNKLNPHATFGVGKFADWSTEEFQSLLGDEPMTEEEWAASEHAEVTSGFEVRQWDWNNETGVVTPIKDQGACGSCWAFSATETIESAYRLAGKELFVSSPQQITSCSTARGCGGGSKTRAMQWVAQNGGLMLDKDYPYTHHDATNGAPCTYKNGENATYAKTTGYKMVGVRDETALAAAVASMQPVAISVDARAWHHYTGGVLTDCTNQHDHAVQIVGFDKDANPPYWKVRNSWGTRWGEQGHIRLGMGLNPPHGLCVLADSPAISTEA